MPWGRARGQNIEHPHTLVIFNFLLFSFIGKAQFRRATLFWDSSYCVSLRPFVRSFDPVSVIYHKVFHKVA